MKKSASVRRLAAAAAAAALVALNLALALSVARADLPRLRGLVDVSFVEMGEALRLAEHAPGVDPAFRMPVDSLLEADLFVRLSPAARSAWAVLIYLSAVLIVFALARELGGDWAGLIAAAAWQKIFLGLQAGPGFFKQFWLTGLGLLAAVALARHARRPRGLSAAGVGAAFGATVLTRSTYFLLPALLAVREAWSAGAPRRRLARAGLLLGVFVLALAPWTAMNAAVKKSFAPFETAANLNVVLGALGAVHGGEGDYVAFMDAPDSEHGRRPVGWAARTVLSHPVRYLSGAARRVEYALGLRLWLFLLAALGFFAARRDAGARALALQCAYFFALVCAMPVEASYFEPLWPLLLALAAAPLSRLEPPPGAAAGARLAAAGVWTAALLGGLIAASASVAALSYAALAARRPPWSDAALDEALALRPAEAWPALDEARRRIRRGDAPGAIGVLQEAAPAIGDLPRWRVLLAWARAKGGDSSDLLALAADPPRYAPFNDDQSARLLVYQALALGAAGKRAEALRKMAEFAGARPELPGYVEPEAEAALDPRISRRAESSLAASLDPILADGDPADMERALELLVSVRPNFEGELELARARAARGRKSAAVQALEKAQALAAEPDQLHRLHFRWAELGEEDRARKCLVALTRRFPERAEYWSDLGVVLFRRGDAAGAEAAFRRALDVQPGMPAATLSLATLAARRGAGDEARRLCAQALASASDDAGLREQLRACAEGRRD